MLTADEVDAGIDFDSMKTLNTMAGSGGSLVMECTVNMCLPCATSLASTPTSPAAMLAVLRGHRGDVPPADQDRGGPSEEREVDLIDQVAKQGEMRTICALFDGCAMPVRSYIPKFRDDFRQLVKRREPGDGKSLPVVTA